MNVLLWGLQIVLALHTAIGAGWKLVNSEQSVPSLKKIPRNVWMGLIAFELACAAALAIPAVAPALGILVPLAAIGIAAEMLLFSGVHLRSEENENGPLYYWLGVVALCAIVAIGRLLVSPL